MASLVNGLGGPAGFGELHLPRADDTGVANIDITPVFGAQGLNYFGSAYTQIAINNNGNITFGGAGFETSLLFALQNSPVPIIAPFFADVDTRLGGAVAPGAVTPTPGGTSTGSNIAWYDMDPSGLGTLTATWDDVGYFLLRTNKLDAFQVQLIGTGGGDFDLVLRYENIDWTSSDASGGTNGIGGAPARVGFSSGDGAALELPASANQAGLLALETTLGNTGEAGVYRYSFHSGTPGADTLAGTSADDILTGAAGSDTVSYHAATAGVTVSLAVSTQQNVGGGQGFDMLVGIENLAGSDFDDTLRGNADANTLDGGDGDDTLSGGAGADQLTGGAGTDTASYVTAGAGVVVSLTSPALNGGDAAGDVFSGVEGLTGSSFNDTLVGDGLGNALAGLGGSDYIEGRGGADSIDGGAGNDRVEGGAGADTLDGGDGFDYARYVFAAPPAVATAPAALAAGTPGLVIDMAPGAINTGDAAGDTFISIEGIVGSQNDDTIGGDGNANDLVGLDGNDRIQGRAGNDGLQGGTGDDTLIGGSGADRLLGDAGDDTASYETATAAVVANLNGSLGNTGDASGDIYLSIEDLLGSGFNDALIGDGNANALTGGDGNDYLQGLAGADHLTGDAGNDSLNGGADADLLDGSLGYDYARYDAAATGVTADLANSTNNAGDAAGDQYVSIEGLVGSAFADDLEGDGESNDIAGLGGADFLAGRGGDDVLQGNAGADELNGGSGVDRSIGGADADVFHFHIGEAHGDAIIDFSGSLGEGDTLVFEGYGAGTFTPVLGSAGRWTIDSADGATHETIVLSNFALVSAVDYSFV